MAARAESLYIRMEFWWEALALPEMLPRLTGIKRCSRRAMAAPSAGSARVHEVEQAAVIAAAFAR